MRPAVTLAHIEAICEIARQQFNFTKAAAVLRRSQPTLSRQVAELEKRLGARVFRRTRNRIVGLTPEGSKVLAIGRRVVKDMDDLERLLNETAAGTGELRIATTHTHARYTLPRVVKQFMERNPKIMLNLRQGGDPLECARLVSDGEADIGVTTEIDQLPEGVVAIPGFRLSRCVFAPREHPITRQPLTLRNIARYPMIAYTRPPGAKWRFGAEFAEAGISPRIVMSAIDADVSKAYVALGLGIAVLAGIAYDPAQDTRLVALNADHLFAPGIIVLLLRKGAPLGRHVLALVSLLAPHLDVKDVQRRVRGAPAPQVVLTDLPAVP